MANWLSLVFPLAYLGVLIGSLATFSSLYRKRKAQKAASVKPWFPPNLQRDIYLSLLHLEPPSSGSKEKKSPQVPESVLKAALLRRATEDITRLFRLRTRKQALSQLLQKGNVGEEVWDQFSRAEKEMEDEFRDVVAEANGFVPGWGETIFQSANEMFLQASARSEIEGIQATLPEEKEWWAKKKASIQKEFMEELDSQDSGRDGPSSKKKAADDNTRLGSDDDAVLVDSSGPSVSSSGGNGGSGGKKKKKGKK